LNRRRRGVANDDDREIAVGDELKCATARVGRDCAMDIIGAKRQWGSRRRITVHLDRHVRTVVGNDDGILLWNEKILARVVGNERRRANDRDAVRKALCRRAAGGAQEEQKQSSRGEELDMLVKAAEPGQQKQIRTRWQT
jgi:hypothetical protein